MRRNDVTEWSENQTQRQRRQRKKEEEDKTAKEGREDEGNRDNRENNYRERGEEGTGEQEENPSRSKATPITLDKMMCEESRREEKRGRES